MYNEDIILGKLRKNREQLDNMAINVANIENGSPKEVYATLVALQTAYPTGAVGAYVVTADGKWYFWNSTAWTEGGTYQSTGIADGTITQKKVSFPVVGGVTSKNLFDKNSVTSGKSVVSTTGLLTASGYRSYTDYIDILPNTAYVKTDATTPIAFYDSSKVYISGLNNSTTFTTPANAAYWRVSPLDTTLDTYQIELGSTQTSYESYAVKINLSALKPNSITPDLLTISPLAAIASKNLFDKTKVTTGNYVAYATGLLSALTTCAASDYIPVTAGLTYTKNDNQQLAYYDLSKVYVSGLASANTFTVPAGVAYVRITVPNSVLDNFQLELGSKTTSYDSYDMKINPLNFPGALSNRLGNVVVVAKSNGDFTTIMGAVNSITDSLATNRYTILIMPGIYEETVSINDKYIDLVALDLGSVTITDKSGAYATPPIGMSCRNNLKNLIIIASHENVGAYTGEPSYAIHHDYDGEGENYIENCKLVSYQSCAFGCGTHNNQQIHLKNCELITDTTGVTFTTTGRPVFLMHNYYQTATNQRVIVGNCRMKCTSDSYVAMNIIDTNNNGFVGATADNRDTELAFYNNTIWSSLNGMANVVKNPTEGSQVGCLDFYIKLSVDSFGNSTSELNAS